MASSQILQNTLTWALPFMKFYPQAIQGNEPAVSNANIILQTILGAPFCWRWNRASKNFVMIAPAGNPQVGTQDYIQAVADFGFIETAYVIDPAAPNQPYELKVKNVLSKEAQIARPGHVAAQYDDNAGNITLRFSGVPDKAYNAEIVYQRKAVLMTSLASPWSPLPDEFSYVFNWGFLALAAILAGDPRFPIFNQRFLSNLLGASDGLDAMQKNIFLGNWTEITKMLERSQMGAQLGTQARAK
jgi:hypothetical protein